MLSSVAGSWRFVDLLLPSLPKTTSFHLPSCVLVHLSDVSLRTSSLLVLLLLLFEQFVNLPLGHGRVLGDDAVLVQARQQQQEAHCGTNSSKLRHFIVRVHLQMGAGSFQSIRTLNIVRHRAGNSLFARIKKKKKRSILISLAFAL